MRSTIDSYMTVRVTVDPVGSVLSHLRFPFQWSYQLEVTVDPVGSVLGPVLGPYWSSQLT